MKLVAIWKIGCRAGRAIINFSGILNHCMEYVSFDYFSFDECFSKGFNRRIKYVFLLGDVAVPTTMDKPMCWFSALSSPYTYLKLGWALLIGFSSHECFFSTHSTFIWRPYVPWLQYTSGTRPSRWNCESNQVMNWEIFEAIPIQHTSENETSIPYFVHTKIRPLEGLSFGGFIGKSKS